MRVLVSGLLAAFFMSGLSGCSSLPPMTMEDFNEGAKYGVGKSLEDPDSALVSLGFRKLVEKSENHRVGVDCDATYFREQLRKETIVADYWHLMCRWTWEWDLFQLGGAPVYAGIGTGGGYVSGDNPLVGGCQGAFSQRVHLGWGMFVPYYQHESTFGFCSPNSGQDYFGLDLTGFINWLMDIF